MKWPTNIGHRVKVVKYQNEVNGDDRKENETEYTENFNRDAVSLVTEQQGYKFS